MTNDQHNDLMMLQMRAEIESLVSEREAMKAANQWRAFCGDSPAYNEDAFQRNAAQLNNIVSAQRMNG